MRFSLTSPPARPPPRGLVRVNIPDPPEEGAKRQEAALRAPCGGEGPAMRRDRRRVVRQRRRLMHPDRCVGVAAATRFPVAISCAAASSFAQSSGGLPYASMRANTAYSSLGAPAFRADGTSLFNHGPRETHGAGMSVIPPSWPDLIGPFLAAGKAAKKVSRCLGDGPIKSGPGGGRGDRPSTNGGWCQTPCVCQPFGGRLVDAASRIQAIPLYRKQYGKSDNAWITRFMRSMTR